MIAASRVSVSPSRCAVNLLPAPLHSCSEGIADACPPPSLLLQVQGMPLRELRTQLVTRGLGSSGARRNLEERLYEQLYEESSVRGGGIKSP